MTQHLFTAHDDKLVTLPADVTTARQARERAEIHLHSLDAPPHPIDVREAVTRATADAFLAGGPLPPVDEILDAERQMRAYEHRLEIGRNTLAALDHRLGTAIQDHAEEIIAELLRPAFDSVVADLRAAFTLLEPFETASRGALALANTKVRKAAADVDTKRDTYTLLTGAAQEVRKLMPPPVKDLDGEFAAFTDIYTVWPRARRTNFGAIPAPWEASSDPLGWQLRNLTPWLPTPAEQDAQWLKVYGEAEREQQVIREKQRAMAATFGKGH